MKPRKIGLTDQELEIMKIVWDRSSATVRELRTPTGAEASRLTSTRRPLDSVVRRTVAESSAVERSETVIPED